MSWTAKTTRGRAENPGVGGGILASEAEGTDKTTWKST